MSIAHAYLLIDPDWEHASEYEVLTLKDFDAPVDDPTSWVPHIDTSIDSVSTEFSWGFNLYGQLGGGSTDNRSAPVQVIDPSDPNGKLTNVVEIAAENHSLALKADGTVWAWGLNEYGRLGDGTQDNRASPVQVIDPSDPTGNLTNVMDIACGAAHSLALKSDGTVWAWGLNDYGQLGDESQGDKTHPVQVSGLTDVVAIAGGGFHSLALKADGTVWAWGRNDHGQLGDGSNVDSSIPVQVIDSSNPPMPFTGVQVVAAGGFTNLALKSDGSVWAWGYNNNGQLGDGSSIDRSFPVQVIDPTDSTGYLTNVMDIAAGASHHLALKTDRSVWAWGYNGQGQLGDGTQLSKTSPVQVLDLTEVVAVAGGAGHSLGLKSDGTVWAWGYNMQGQLGNGATTDSSIPVQVIDPSDPTGNLTNVTDIACGANHSLALKSITSTDYTAEGIDVEIRPVDAATGTSPITLTFDNVTEPGITSLSTSTGGPPPSEGFMLGTPPIYYYLMTTAIYEGQIEVCIDYSGVSFDEAPAGLYHYENGEWVDVTTSHEGSIICGRVSSLSPFTLFEPSPIVVSGRACVNVGKGKGKMANKLTVSANENYYKEVYVTIDKVEIFNNGGQAVKGKGVYEIDGNNIYVYPKGKGWALCVTVIARDVNGSTLKTEQVCRSLEKCKK